MCKTKGAKNYFKDGNFYYLRDSIGYCKTKGITVPEEWKKGTLHNYAREWGITPTFDNGGEGRAHREKYSARQMYWFCKNLIGILKAQKKPSVLPLEQMANEAKKKPKKVEPVEEEISAPLDSNFLEIANSFIELGEARKRALGVM